MNFSSAHNYLYIIDLAGIPVIFSEQLIKDMPLHIKDHCKIRKVCKSGFSGNEAVRVTPLDMSDIKSVFRGTVSLHPIGQFKNYKNRNYYYISGKSARNSPSFLFIYDRDKKQCAVQYPSLALIKDNLYHIAHRRVLDPLFNGLCDVFLYAVILVGKDGFIIHGAGAVDANNNGILICGHSGAGKTTLCDKILKSGYKILSDDCVIVRKKGKVFYVFPTPWQYKSKRIVGAKGFPLSKIVFLEKEPGNKSILKEVPKTIAFAKMLEFIQFSLSLDKKTRLAAINILSLLTEKTNAFTLRHSLIDKSVIV